MGPRRQIRTAKIAPRAEKVSRFIHGKGDSLGKANPLTAELFNWNFHPLEVVDRVSETQLQVGENYLDLTTNFKSC